MKTLGQFYELVEATRDVRVDLVQAILDGHPPDPGGVEALQRALDTLRAVPEQDGRKQLRVEGSGTVSLEMDYEIAELEKDLIYLRQGPEALDRHLASLHADFEQHVARAVALLEPVHFNNFVTDRDGTISNYCGRYRSSVQSAYNAVFLARFARARTRNATIVTSAPLRDPGLATVSVMPVGTYIYAASKAREFLDRSGERRTLPVDPHLQAKLDAINARILELTRQPRYHKFTLIGSGVQFKFGETTVARQDVARTVSDAESEAFRREVESIVREVDPEGRDTHIDDTGLDVEIVLSSGSASEFTKADGLDFLDRDLGLGLAEGRTLVCGDTPPDLNLVHACTRKNPQVWTLFVTRDPSLAERVAESAPHALVLPEVDMLVTALDRVARKALLL